MGKETVDGLNKFLLPYPDKVKMAALWLREFVWDLYPEINELIYDNYNAVAFGWSPTDKAGDVFCSIAVCSDHVNFGFNRGVDLHGPQKICWAMARYTVSSGCATKKISRKPILNSCLLWLVKIRLEE